MLRDLIQLLPLHLLNIEDKHHAFFFLIKCSRLNRGITGLDIAKLRQFIKEYTIKQMKIKTDKCTKNEEEDQLKDHIKID